METPTNKRYVIPSLTTETSRYTIYGKSATCEGNDEQFRRCFSLFADNGNFPQILQKADINIIPFGLCHRTYYNTKAEQHICVGNGQRNGKNICNVSFSTISFPFFFSFLFFSFSFSIRFFFSRRLYICIHRELCNRVYSCISRRLFNRIYACIRRGLFNCLYSYIRWFFFSFLRCIYPCIRQVEFFFLYLC